MYIYICIEALNTHHPHCLCVTLKVLQHLVTCHKSTATVLIPYYRQILPVLNTFKSKNVNIGDEIDYGQRRRETL
ncbi:hypothetical protein HELRODRAFT_90310 [Helobdella robusta]|uniref:Uncharacterized protein n=1 Tax=Helobdella robusta TaxID=6412 RepID=T1G7P1_HELRO|nr:hypothetical protein HELRODRAFT_90310 [Helobdella robusta]ESN91270.1 hypothetical protein HELRODRAFT_90310 [Helobdella robusta]